MGSHHSTTGIQYNITGFNFKRAPVQEPEVEQTIKVEEPESKRFKKDDVMREKTRRENIERDDKIAREKVNLIREKQNLVREEQNLAREKPNLAREEQNLAREKQNLAREEQNLAREKPNLAREKETLVRDTIPARENKTIQNISTGTTPARVTASSQVFTSAYTQSARHDRSLGIITKSDSSLVVAKPDELKTEGFKFNNERKAYALMTWKNLLIKTRDYIPFRVRTIASYKASIKKLIGAMRNYKDCKPAGNLYSGSMNSMHSCSKSIGYLRPTVNRRCSSRIWRRTFSLLTITTGPVR